MKFINVDFSKSKPGVIAGSYKFVVEQMPELFDVLTTFPDDKERFSFDVKVHMLMPGQYPCIPNWHYDNVPRPDGIQDFSKCNYDLPMYLWLSGPPLTQFVHGYVQPRKWIRFTQRDIHRGNASDDFVWRCFIRANHVDIVPVRNLERRHSQVYLDANTYQW